MRLIMSFLAAVAVLGIAVACGDDDDAGGSDSSLTVVASNDIVADWVTQVGGDNVEVSSLVPSGADLHTFQLTPDEVRRIAAADLVVLVGAGLESAFESTVRQNAGGPVVELAEGLELNENADDGGDDREREDDQEDGDDLGHDHGRVDPHIWMDLDLAIQAVERIAQELETIDPENAEAYHERGEAYIAELRDLDAEIRTMLAELSEEERLLVTFHDAFGYFADRYDLEVLGFVVESADEEPDARRLAELIEEMRERGATAVYVEPQFSSRVIEQVASETGAEIRVVPSDTLSEEYPTYIEMMRTLARGIAG